MAAGNRSTAFHQAVCRTATLHSPWERAGEAGREGGGGEVRRMRQAAVRG